MTFVYKRYPSFDGYATEFMENIKTLIRLKRDFNTKYLDIQANMALCKIEEEKFEIDTFYAYDNEG